MKGKQTHAVNLMRKLSTGVPPGSLGSPGGPASAGGIREAGSILGSGRSLGGGNGTLLQYSCPGNSMDRGAWKVTVHVVAKNWTQLSN